MKSFTSLCLLKKKLQKIREHVSPSFTDLYYENSEGSIVGGDLLGAIFIPASALEQVAVFR